MFGRGFDSSIPIPSKVAFSPFWGILLRLMNLDFHWFSEKCL